MTERKLKMGTKKKYESHEIFALKSLQEVQKYFKPFMHVHFLIFDVLTYG